MYECLKVKLFTMLFTEKLKKVCGLQYIKIINRIWKIGK